MIDQLAIFAAEVKKVAREVGTEGKLGVQARSVVVPKQSSRDILSSN